MHVSAAAAAAATGATGAAASLLLWQQLQLLCTCGCTSKPCKAAESAASILDHALANSLREGYTFSNACSNIPRLLKNAVGTVQNHRCMQQADRMGACTPLLCLCPQAWWQ
jgi:hypothetical protein